MEGGKEFKIGMAVAAFVLTLVLSLGGFNYYKQYVISQPLQKSIISVPGVTGVMVNGKKDPVVIDVTLNNKADLKNAYLDIDRLASDRMGDKPYTIMIDDNASGTLNKTYERLELAVYQGIANNSYLWLAERVEEESASIGAGYRLQVDENNIYITLVKDNKNLCRVISRESVINGGQGKEEVKQSA